MVEDSVEKETKKGLVWKGVYWALFYAATSFIAGLQYKKEGNIGKTVDSFLGAAIVLIGVTMYVLAKRRKAGLGFWGSRIVETIFFLIVLYVFLMGLLNTGWQNSPLDWTVIPLWSIVVYLMAAFSKRKT